jgi:aryl-alcohol dehydrogenase-like predicted oxidoreductase
MRYRLFGRSGLRVSELALGTMTFGEDWGWGASKEDSRRIFDRFAEAGGNFVDTANNYTDGSSEGFVGERLPRVRSRPGADLRRDLGPDRLLNSANHRARGGVW